MSEVMWRLPATELQRRYREGTLSPVEALESCLARLEAVNPALNAVIARRDSSARAEAQESERRYAQGGPLSPLDGVPLTVKDSLFTHDLPTTWGTRALREYRPGHDEL